MSAMASATRSCAGARGAFDNFRVVPPGTGICHQVNLEYLAQTVWTQKDEDERQDRRVAYPDTLVGTDSHTTMVNGLAVLGWGVGGIEAEAAMLGQPISMLIPEVIGFKLTGKLREGITATDLVLTVTADAAQEGRGRQVRRILRRRASTTCRSRTGTIANMAPGIWRDLRLLPGRSAETLRYLKSTGRDRATASRWSRPMPRRRACSARKKSPDPIFTDTLELDLATVEPSMAGPKRPQDRVRLGQCRSATSPTVHGPTSSGKADDTLAALPGRRHQFRPSAMATW